MTTIDVYHDMTLKELQKEFGKSPQSVTNGVARMLERNPEHPEWRYKEGNKTMICAAGVEWLSKYFRHDTALQIMDESKIRLEMDNKHLKELLESEREHARQMASLYQEMLQERLEAEKRTFLIEEQSKDARIAELEAKIERLMNRSLIERIKNKQE